MAIATTATNGTTSASDPISFTHTPSGTPRWVVVFVFNPTDSGDVVVGVTYGGVAMTEVGTFVNMTSGTENGSVYCFFLGASVPTGAQTVSVDVSSTTRSKRVQCISGTASADVEVHTSGTLESGGVANPSITLTTSKTTTVFAGLLSGAQAVGDLTEVAGYTALNENDFGNMVSAVIAQDSVASGSPAPGWTAASEEAGMIALAISEISGAAAEDNLGWMGAGQYGYGDAFG